MYPNRLFIFFKESYINFWQVAECFCFLIIKVQKRWKIFLKQKLPLFKTGLKKHLSLTDKKSKSQ